MTCCRPPGHSEAPCAHASILCPKETAVAGGRRGVKGAALPCWAISQNLAIVSKWEEGRDVCEEARAVSKPGRQETRRARPPTAAAVAATCFCRLSVTCTSAPASPAGSAKTRQPVSSVTPRSQRPWAGDDGSRAGPQAVWVGPGHLPVSSSMRPRVIPEITAFGSPARCPSWTGQRAMPRPSPSRPAPQPKAAR